MVVKTKLTLLSTLLGFSSNTKNTMNKVRAPLNKSSTRRTRVFIIEQKNWDKC